MPSCGGCRTCEMACSYHHTGEFNPARSSFIIVEKEDEAGYVLQLLEQATGGAIACDGCQGLDEPLCLQYCREHEELLPIMTQFFEKAGITR